MNSRLFLAVISKMLNREIHVALLKDYFVSKIVILHTVYTCCLIQSCPSPNTTCIVPILKLKSKEKDQAHELFTYVI